MKRFFVQIQYRNNGEKEVLNSNIRFTERKTYIHLVTGRMFTVLKVTDLWKGEKKC